MLVYKLAHSALAIRFEFFSCLHYPSSSLCRMRERGEREVWERVYIKDHSVFLRPFSFQRSMYCCLDSWVLCISTDFYLVICASLFLFISCIEFRNTFVEILPYKRTTTSPVFLLCFTIHLVFLPHFSFPNLSTSHCADLLSVWSNSRWKYLKHLQNHKS